MTTTQPHAWPPGGPAAKPVVGVSSASPNSRFADASHQSSVQFVPSVASVALPEGGSATHHGHGTMTGTAGSISFFADGTMSPRRQTLVDSNLDQTARPGAASANPGAMPAASASRGASPSVPRDDVTPAPSISRLQVPPHASPVPVAPGSARAGVVVPVCDPNIQFSHLESPRRAALDVPPQARSRSAAVSVSPGATSIGAAAASVPRGTSAAGAATPNGATTASGPVTQDGALSYSVLTFSNAPLLHPTLGAMTRDRLLARTESTQSPARGGASGAQAGAEDGQGGAAVTLDTAARGRIELDPVGHAVHTITAHKSFSPRRSATAGAASAAERAAAAERARQLAAARAAAEAAEAAERAAAERAAAERAAAAEEKKRKKRAQFEENLREQREARARRAEMEAFQGVKVGANGMVVIDRREFRPNLACPPPPTFSTFGTPNTKGGRFGALPSKSPGGAQNLSARRAQELHAAAIANNNDTHQNANAASAGDSGPASRARSPPQMSGVPADEQVLAVVESECAHQQEVLQQLREEEHQQYEQKRQLRLQGQLQGPRAGSASPDTQSIAPTAAYTAYTSGRERSPHRGMGGGTTQGGNASYYDDGRSESAERRRRTTAEFYVPQSDFKKAVAAAASPWAKQSVATPMPAQSPGVSVPLQSFLQPKAQQNNSHVPVLVIATPRQPGELAEGRSPSAAPGGDGLAPPGAVVELKSASAASVSYHLVRGPVEPPATGGSRAAAAAQPRLVYVLERPMDAEAIREQRERMSRLSQPVRRPSAAEATPAPGPATNRSGSATASVRAGRTPMTSTVAPLSARAGARPSSGAASARPSGPEVAPAFMRPTKAFLSALGHPVAGPGSNAAASPQRPLLAHGSVPRGSQQRGRNGSVPQGHHVYPQSLGMAAYVDPIAMAPPPPPPQQPQRVYNGYFIGRDVPSDEDTPAEAAAAAAAAAEAAAAEAATAQRHGPRTQQPPPPQSRIAIAVEAVTPAGVVQVATTSSSAVGSRAASNPDAGVVAGYADPYQNYQHHHQPGHEVEETHHQQLPDAGYASLPHVQHHHEVHSEQHYRPYGTAGSAAGYGGEIRVAPVGAIPMTADASALAESSMTSMPEANASHHSPPPQPPHDFQHQQQQQQQEHVVVVSSSHEAPIAAGTVAAPAVAQAATAATTAFTPSAEVMAAMQRAHAATASARAVMASDEDEEE